MVKILDDVLMRLLFILLLITILYLYKVIYLLFSPKQISQKQGIYLIKDNAAQVLHFFSRLIGICFVFKSIGFSFSTDIIMNMIHFTFWALISIFIYLLNIFILNSATLYQFDYGDEIIKKQNTPYAFISSFFSIASAYIFIQTINTAGFSLRNFFILWLTTMTMVVLVLKLYQYISKMNFTKLLNQKRDAIAYSYLGYSIAVIMLVVTATTSWIAPNLVFYLQVVSAKVLLILITFPLLNLFITKSFKRFAFQTKEDQMNEQRFNYKAYGIFEGACFTSTGLLISVLIDKVFLYQLL